jgi:Glycosyltransferase family 28 C-terminal domain/Glycosyl transferase family 1
MKTIAYYISDYGYGHASRSIAIIRELLRKDQELRVVICHSFAMPFVQDSLSEFGVRVIYHTVKTDMGYVLHNQSLQVDKDGLKQELQKFLDELPKVINREVNVLEELDVQCVVTDISFLAVEVADSLGVPSIGISNFTWYTAYQGMVEDKHIQKQLKSSYDKMKHYYALAGSKEDWKRQQYYGYFSRKTDLVEVSRFKQLLNPDGTKNIVFLPIGLKIDIGDISNLPLWDDPNCVFVVSQNMNVHHPNIHQVPAGYNEVQNIVAASDLVISKAGWGTCAEAVIAGKPLLLIERKGFKEDQNTTEALLADGLAKVVQWEDLDKIDFTQIISSYKPTRILENNSDQISSDILSLLV